MTFAIRAHFLGLLRALQPGQPCAAKALASVVVGALGLALAARTLGRVEPMDRLFSAMWLLFAASGLSGLRLAIWAPRLQEALPLPLGRRRRCLTELALYLGLVQVGAWIFGLISALVTMSPPWVALPHMGGATLLLLPLLLGVAPGEGRHGPVALLRLFLPWLPLGWSSLMGWLDSPLGLAGTALAMSAVAGALLLARGTGWEDWWPRLGGGRLLGARRGLPPRQRLREDFRRGLLRALAWGVPLSLLGWTLLAWRGEGVLWDLSQVAGMLSLAGAWMVGAHCALALPLETRLPGWKPPQLPWALLPLPHGAVQRAIFRHQISCWGILMALQALGLLLHYHLLPPDPARFVALECIVGMLAVMMAVLVFLEGCWGNSPRGLGLVSRGAVLVLGLLSAQLPLFAASFFLRESGGMTPQDALSWAQALARLLQVLGPSILLGLAWLAAGWWVVRRDASSG